MSRAVLHCGDVRAVLAQLPERSVQMVCTSPPYFGLRDYGVPGQIGLERTPEEYVANMVAVFSEVRRVLRDDGVLWLNLGDSYANNGQTGLNKNSGKSTLGPKRDGLGANNAAWKRTRPPQTVPPGLKPKDLVGIPWMVAFALRADGWYLRSDIIWAKCLSGGTTVYAKTRKGEMPMTVKDMVRLDPSTVRLWDGEKWNQVVGWGDVPGDTDRKRKSARRRSAKYRGETLSVEGDIELEFRSGERAGCTRSHKWPTHRGVVQAGDLVVGDVVPTVALPEPPTPVSPAALADEDCGWFVGMYLAEGSQSDGTLQFSGHQREVERNARLKRIAEMFHGYCAVHHAPGNGCTANVNGPMLRALVETYIAGRTAKDKHLHPRCWSRSNAFLRSLLLGYLEGDGHRRGNGSWRLGFTNNDALAVDLRTLAARLGASVRLRRAVATNTSTGKKHKCWRGDLVFDRSLRRGPDGEIIAIRQSRARLFHNISLAEEPHIFALASGICTKNSNPMPESVTDRPTKSHEYLFLLTKAPTYYYDAAAIAEPAEYGFSETVVRSNGRGWDHDAKESKTVTPGKGGTRNARSVWTIATQPYPQAHFATFPEELARRCILAGSSAKACESCGAPWERVTEREAIHDSRPRPTERIRPDHGWGGLNQTGSHTHMGTRSETTGWQPTCACEANTGAAPSVVLDPFSGSGTTCAVAIGHGRSAIYVDLNPAYLELARQRIGPLLCDDAPEPTVEVA